MNATLTLARSSNSTTNNNNNQQPSESVRERETFRFVTGFFPPLFLFLFSSPFPPFPFPLSFPFLFFCAVRIADQILWTVDLRDYFPSLIGIQSFDHHGKPTSGSFTHDNRYDDLSWTSAACNDPDAPIPSASLVSAADPSLTAFAQLLVYRLAATRALVSLFDRHRQHVVAEATRKSPVAPNEPSWQNDTNNNDGTDAGEDQFWLCGTAIPRSYGICEHVLLSSSSAAQWDTNNDDDEEEDTLPISVIPDLATDARFQSRPYVHARPFNRFYAGVPIRTPGPHGINIGVLCVFGSQPRAAPGLDRDAAAFMQDLSRTVMGYLECRVAQRRFRRSERMNRGMGNFVEGLGSLAASAGCANRSVAPSKRSPRLAVAGSAAADGGGGVKEGGVGPNGNPKRPLAVPPKSGQSGWVIDEALMSSRTFTPAVSSSSSSSSLPRDPVPIVVRASSSLEPSAAAPGNPTGAGSRPPSGSLILEDSSRCSTPRPESSQSRTPAVLSEVSTADLQLAQSVRVFAKAANIIRQSLEIDGVLFLDATVRSFGGLVGQQSERKISSAVGMGVAETVSYLSNDEDSTAMNHNNTASSAANKEDCCNVLGFSTPEASSIGGDSVPWQFEGLRDRTLQRLLRRYPQGQIFSYEADGSVLQTPLPLDGEPSTPGLPPRRPASPLRQWSHDSQAGGLPVMADGSSETSSPPGQQHKGPTMPRQRWNAAESIAHLFPGARSVIIVPLWDSQKKRWAAGGFAWTNNPTRVFSVDGALAFLRVFGLIVMAELYRLNTKAEETIKSNILGSISHELRSPLHGLVGAVELLHDSRLDAVQQTVLNIIETSGKTLVDTINHLLDYSKINSFIESDRAETKKDTVLGKVGAEPTERSVQEKARSQTLPVELDCLVEEVVESVLAGYSHERLSRPHAARDTTQYGRYGFPFGGHGNMGISSSAATTTTNPADSPQDRVQIYLDIEPSTSWRFRTHPGAFRRIVMNLFGNSLKFTKSGFIKITLAQEVAKPYPNHSRATVLLTVADSGKGISEDYLRNHLFTPFCQEDNFAPGTGLGLSLVRQITVNLGGEVKVASQVGKGTTITVSLPLPNASEDLGSLELTESKQDITCFKGRKVLLRGFDGAQTTTTPTTASDLRPRSTRGADDLGKMLDSQAYYLEVTCRKWLEMEVMSEEDARTQQPDFIIHQDSTLSFAEAEIIGAQAPCPVLFVCDASVAVRNFSWNLPDAASRIRTFEFFSAPLGPRKLAKGLAHLHEMWKVKQEQNDAVHHTTSVEVLPAAGGRMTLSTQEVEVGNHVTLIKSTRTSMARDEAAVGTNASTQTKESPLPTPPDEPSMKYPMSRSDFGASSPLDGPSKIPSVLIVDDNAINLKVSHSKQASNHQA